MKKYKHLFFDLDKTIWDFDTNSAETLSDVFNLLNLKQFGIHDFDKFVRNYEIHNDQLWALYREEKIEKEKLKWFRFEKTFNEFNVSNPELAFNFGKTYLEILPSKKTLFPHSIEVLEYLYVKYDLHLLTNGFDEVQFRKIENSNIAKYFTSVTTSDEAGAKKPDEIIFNYALEKAEATANESLMIGDDLEVDIIGAMNSGMDQVFFNHKNLRHNELPTFEINSLMDLFKIL